jgi:hypothetical protein
MRRGLREWSVRGRVALIAGMQPVGRTEKAQGMSDLYILRDRIGHRFWWEARRGGGAGSVARMEEIGGRTTGSAAGGGGVGRA